MEYVINAMESRPMRYHASIVLHGTPAELEGALRPRAGELEPLAEGRSLFRTQEDSLGWLTVRLLWLGVDFEVREPPELVDYVRGLAARLAGSVAANDR